MIKELLDELLGMAVFPKLDVDLHSSYHHIMKRATLRIMISQRMRGNYKFLVMPFDDKRSYHLPISNKPGFLAIPEKLCIVVFL